jgi:hypothetical protein
MSAFAPLVGAKRTSISVVELRVHALASALAKKEKPQRTGLKVIREALAVSGLT